MMCSLMILSKGGAAYAESQEDRVREVARNCI